MLRRRHVQQPPPEPTPRDRTWRREPEHDPMQQTRRSAALTNATTGHAELPVVADDYSFGSFQSTAARRSEYRAGTGAGAAPGREHDRAACIGGQLRRAPVVDRTVLRGTTGDLSRSPSGSPQHRAAGDTRDDRKQAVSIAASVCPKTGSTSPSLTVHLCLHTAGGSHRKDQ